jgi:hypothetical protein
MAVADVRCVSAVCSWRRLLPACLALVLPSAAGADPKNDDKAAVTVTATRSPGNAFGDQEIEFRFRVEAARAAKGRVVWRLAAGTATVKAGEADFGAGVDAPADVPIKIGLPPVKDGVVLQTRLTVSVVEAGQTKPAAALAHDLWLFPKDPFADRSEWLKKRKIALFDPAGATAKVLTAANVPFDEVRSVDAVAQLGEGTLVVGEGVSFKDERGLGTALQKLAAAGRPVLCLAPAAGEVVIPGIGGPAGLRDLSFRQEIVRQMDKRLDPDGVAAASSIAVKPGEEGAVGEVTAGPGGWTWIEANYGTGKGRWAVCGLAIIAKWERGPTPRFLFARMLEYLTDAESEQPKKETER